MTDEQIKQFRDRMEAIIEKSGHFIQGVMDGENSFAYTIGLTDHGMSEFYIQPFANVYASLLNSIPAAYIKGEMMIGVPFHYGEWITKDKGQKTWFVLDYATPEQIEGMIGAYSRARRKGQSILKPLQIIIADKDNKLPAQYVFS